MSRLIPGQSVVLPGNVFGTVVDFPSEDRVRIAWPHLGRTQSVYYADEVKTRAEAMHSARYLLTRIANELDDLDLMDCLEQSAVYVERAAQRADAADAGKGLAS